MKSTNIIQLFMILERHQDIQETKKKCPRKKVKTLKKAFHPDTVDSLFMQVLNSAIQQCCIKSHECKIGNAKLL